MPRISEVVEETSVLKSFNFEQRTGLLSTLLLPHPDSCFLVIHKGQAYSTCNKVCTVHLELGELH